VSELSTHEPVSDGILRYLNRLSDVLWLMARLTETEFVR
jgi:cob(I)alamin adenosyltransferase